MMKKVSCPKCDGWGHISVANENGISGYQCKECLGTGQIEVPMTNADRIRAMSDEELAEWLKEMWDCNLCPEAERLDDHPLWGDEQCNQECARHCLEWLQRPCKN